MVTEAQINNIILRTAPICQKYAKLYGYKICSPAIAQILQESLGKYEGLSLLAYEYHNLHGIKCGDAWVKAGKPSINMKTGEEYIVGKTTMINDYFRVYASEDEGIRGYYEFLQYKRYAAVKLASTPYDYLVALKAAGYCTSSTYVDKCMNKIQTYDLTKYDGPTVPPDYILGKTYTTVVNLYIRREPKGDNLTLNDITENAKKNAFEDETGVVLKKNTRVTVKDIKEVDGAIWLKIPSGWICGTGASGKVYVT